MDRESINDIRIAEKAFLTLKEAASYFNIGQDKIRQLTDERDCTFVLFNGNKRLVKRELMEGYLINSIQFSNFR